MEWMKMPDASGFGDYEESGSGTQAVYRGQPCNFSVQMYLDDEPAGYSGEAPPPIGHVHRGRFMSHVNEIDLRVQYDVEYGDDVCPTV
jgi:hypothetical protein